LWDGLFFLRAIPVLSDGLNVYVNISVPIGLGYLFAKPHCKGIVTYTYRHTSTDKEGISCQALVYHAEQRPVVRVVSGLPPEVAGAWTVSVDREPLEQVHGAAEDAVDGSSE